MGLRDRDHIEQMRLRERIGNYFKYVDHAMINNPDPKSAHYMNGNFISLISSRLREIYERFCCL